jgi:hypothetical protein
MQTPHWILKNTGLYYIFIYTYVQCYGEILNSQLFPSLGGIRMLYAATSIRLA